MGTHSSGLKYADVSKEVIQSFYAVYNELGHGYLESIYEKALWLELARRGVPAEAQCRVTVWFHNHPVGDFRADLVVADKVLVELKSAKAIDPAHEAQVLNYLRATDLEVGLLVNFGPQPEFKRFLFENHLKRSRNPR